ncbi:MAG: glutamate synthase [Planctomycetota bacterium]
MVDLYCTPFAELIQRLALEFARQEAMFDLPQRKWYLPQDDDLDLSVPFHDQRAANAAGPASGPQSQMAQNVVLSWLGGGRIMELKTVQINDRLEIGRPCIDATNVGYNIEWSQELLVEQSLDQYVQGAMLVHALAHAPEVFGHPFGDVDMRPEAQGTLYDMSIGYDLQGIQSEKVRRFMEAMIDARESIERLRDQIPNRFARLRELEYPTQLSRSVTLSTFHGCPADEIERICEFLLTEMGVHTIVKMNPPMLGKERLEHLLHDVMGYHELTVHQEAYTNGLQFDESVEMTHRLRQRAAEQGLTFGAKFSNTLEVENHRDFFDSSEKVMYLSGAPLHVITLTLAHEYRKAVGQDVPISFSAGVDRKNFLKLVQCGFTPITTCTDLLKVGGYGRLPPYLTELRADMQRCGASNVPEYMLNCRDARSQTEDVTTAGMLNTAAVVAEAQADPRYRHAKNAAVPRRIDSHLTLFDCITCYKCIPVCPNDANFVYETQPSDFTYRDLEIDPEGVCHEVGEPQRFQLERQEQIANFADYCNHCGNCDTFCPEYDGPYLMKPSFFGSRAAFDAGAPHDGFFVETPSRMIARIDSQVIEVEKAKDIDGWSFVSADLTLTYRDGTWACTRAPETNRKIEIGILHSLRTLLDSISDARRIHAVNTPFLT